MRLRAVVVAGLLAAISLARGQTPPAPVSPSDNARDLIRDGHYAEAAALAHDLLTQEETQSGPDSLQVADIIDIVVEAERLDGKVKDAGTRDLARRAIRIKEAVLGSDHPDVARSVNSLANLLAESGDYAGAKPLFQRVLAIQEGALNPNNPLLGKTLNNLANLISDMGDYTGSVPLYERSLRIKEKAYGAEDPQLISTLVGLAILQRLMGDYTEARQQCDRALHIAESKLRPGHPRRASAMSTLASISVETGDYAEAKNLLEQSLALQQQELGPDHPDLAATLGDLGNLQRDAGDLKAARALYERSLDIQSRGLEPESAYLVQNMTNLGEVLQKLGDTEGARSQLEHGLKIRESQFGPDHPDVADSLGALAGLLEEKGDLPAARELLERGLHIRETALGPAHPLVAESLARLARIAARAGDDSKALDLAHQAETIGRQHLRVIARALPERQALQYASGRPSGLGLELEVASRDHRGASTRIAWDDSIHSRALVLDEMASRQRAVVATEDRPTQELRSKLASARAQEAALWVRGVEDQDPGSYRRVLEAARRTEEQVERELAAKSLAFRQEQINANIGLPDVLKALPRGSALVAYIVTGRTGTGSALEPPRYFAFVLGPSGEFPRIVRLDVARKIDELVTRWRGSVAGEPSPIPAVARLDEQAGRAIGIELRAAIWDPVARYVERAHQVFVVPDGTLNLVSYAALPTNKDRYLVETGPTLHYLSAEADLTRDTASPLADRSLLAVGGPDFDGVPVAQRTSDGNSTVARTKDGSSRGPRPGCDAARSLHFDPLPGARSEIDEVTAIWSRNRSSPAGGFLSLEGGDATKDSVERLAPRYGIVHLATHAFFFDDACVSDHTFRPTVNPLLLSGLAFAGANRGGGADPGEARADAILTAEEIASMDLSRVSWVVLSGCETGLGAIHPGEGVLGLRRAVKVAGARTLIMSLWKAKDEPTRHWMRRLYERRLSGLSTAQAVRSASLDIIAERRAAGDSAHPFYWGAFVAAGDWR